METYIDKFALNFNDKHLSLKVSILNNQQILLELTDKDTKQIFYNAITLQQLKTVTNAFNSISTTKDAYNILIRTIETGKIMIGESDSSSAMELQFNIDLQTGTYSPFSILLYLSQGNGNTLEIQQSPSTLNYQRNNELETKYGGVAKDTTEIKSFVQQSNVQTPFQMGYIAPILQLQYPNDLMKNTLLQPSIQGLNQNFQKSLPLQGIQTNQAGKLEESSQRQLKLANMTSIINQRNPNIQNMNLENLVSQTNQRVQNDEQSILSQASISSKVSKIDGGDENDFEALYLTEEGKIIFRNGLLRGIIHKYKEIDDVVTKIQDIFLKGVRFNLEYKAFDFDDKAKTFHEKCDKIETSLVLIETDKDVRFGGFTTKSWRGNNVKKIDNYSFVFNLDTNKIFDVIPNQPAIGCYPNYGPVFFGCQIRIYDEFFKKGGTTCHKGLNFKTTKDFELNNGVKNFLIKDIEVYSLENMDVD